MKITVPAERVRRPPKLRSLELSRGRRPDATSAAATLVAPAILFDIVPSFSTIPILLETTETSAIRSSHNSNLNARQDQKYRFTVVRDFVASLRYP